jgi:outer membrane protein assembly factor BamB
MDGTLYAVDPVTGGLTEVHRLTDRPTLIAADGAGVWVAHFETGAVTRIDRASGEIVATIVLELPFDVGTGPDRRRFLPIDMVVGRGSVWVSTARGAVARIDVATNALVEMFELTPPHPGQLAVGPNGVWVAEDIYGLTHIDADTGAVSTLRVRGADSTDGVLSHTVGQVSVVDDQLYVAGVRPSLAVDEARIVSQIDPETMQVVRTALITEGASVFLGWIDGAFGVLDATGTFRRVVPGPDLLGESFATDWDLASGVIQVGDQAWMIHWGESRMSRLTVTGPIDGPAHLEPSARWSVDGIGVAHGTNLLSRGSLVLRDSPYVFVADGSGETVTALHLVTGEQLWQQTVDGGVAVLLGISSDSVIVGGYGLVAALDPATGAEQWRFVDPSGGLWPMAAYAGPNGIHALLDRPTEGDTEPPVVMTFDRADGSVIWRTPLDGVDHPDLDLQTGSSSSALVGDRLFVKTTGTMHALDARTGEILWIHRFAAVPHESYLPAPLLVDGELLFVPDPDGELVALEVQSGRQRWRLEVEPGFVAPVSIDGGLIVFVDGEGVHAADADSGDRVWDHPMTGAHAAVVGDVVVVLGGRQLTGLDPDTGKARWSASVDLDIPYAVLAAGDVAVAAAEDGVVAVVADTGAVLWELNRGVAEPPVIVDDSILLAHSDDHRTIALYPIRPVE